MLSNWTIGAVHRDRTDTPNLGDWKIQCRASCGCRLQSRSAVGRHCLPLYKYLRFVVPPDENGWHTGCDTVRNACFGVLVPRGGAIAALRSLFLSQGTRLGCSPKRIELGTSGPSAGWEGDSAAAVTAPSATSRQDRCTISGLPYLPGFRYLFRQWLQQTLCAW
jgi:hypothetical protein